MKFDTITKALVRGPDGKILLLRRSNTDTRRPNEWDFPGGHVDEGETSEEAVIREIKEEAGIGAHLEHLLFAKTECVSWGEGAANQSNVTWMYYGARTREQTVQLSFEHSEWKWVELDEALDMITYSRHVEVLQHVKDNNLLQF